MDVDAPVTVEEQYERAVMAGRLDAGDGASPTDLLVAMAWTGNDIGPLLYRLRAEHDQAKGRQQHALQHQRQLQEAIRTASVQLKRASRPGSPQHAQRDKIAEDLQALHDQAERDALLDHAAVLSLMPTLPAARQALGHWAEAEANRYIVRGIKPHPLLLKSLQAKALRDRSPGPSPWYFELWRQEQRRHRALVQAARGTTLTPAAVRSLVGVVLQAFIDPACRSCTGRGRKGGNGRPEVVCPACRGTGRAQDALNALGQSEEQREFARYLLATMEQTVEAVDRRMRSYLRGRNFRG